MQKIEWNSSFNIGIEEIDTDHQRFVALSNDFYDAILSNASSEELMRFLETIEQYAAEHFTREEALMLQYSFSELEAHKRSHQSFKNIIHNFKHTYIQNSDKEQLKELHEEIVSWILEHIVEEDIKLAQLIQSKNKKGFWSRVSIKVRLLSLVIFPSLLIILFLLHYAHDFYKQYVDAQKIHTSVTILENINTLSAALQKERGLSVAYLHAKSDYFHKALIAQRQVTQNAFERFLHQKNFLTKDIFCRYAEVKDFRKSVDTLSISVRKALQLYTQCITSLLHYSTTTAFSIEQNRALRARAMAINALFYKLESFGLERALGTVILQKNYTQQEALDFIHFQEQERIYTQEFMAYATKKQKIYYVKDYTTQQMSKQAEEYLKSVELSLFTKESLKIVPSEFFNVMSQNMDSLQHFLQKHLVAFDKSTQKSVDRLQSSLEYIAVGLIVYLLLSIYLMYKIQRSIYKPIDSFSKALSMLSRDKEQFYKLNESHEYYFGYLEGAYEQLKLKFLKLDANQVLQKQKSRILEDMAYIDTLTGVANRRKFDKLLRYEFKRSKRYKRPFSLIMVDIDHFKKFNDTYGHEVGDVVLKACAEVIVSTSRGSDVVARLGGEEFVLLLPETLLDDAVILAHKIRESVEALEVVHEEHQLHITISLGVAQFLEYEIDPYEVLRNADEALYDAKADGRNRVCKFEISHEV